MKLADQQARLHYACDVKMRRIRDGGYVWLGNENLPGVDQERFADLICQITADRPFQNKDLDVEVGVMLDYASGTCARGRDRGSLDLHAAGAFRYLEKHCTFAQVHGADSVVETENRFRA